MIKRRSGDCARLSVLSISLKLISFLPRLVIPAKARDYVFTGVGLSVCLSVFLLPRGRIWTKFFGTVPRGKSKPKFVVGYDR